MVEKSFSYSNLNALTELFLGISGDNLTLSATLIPGDERFVDFVRNGYSRIHPTESSPLLPAIVSDVPIDLKAFNGLPPNVRHVLQYIGELKSLCEEFRINPFYALEFSDIGDDYVQCSTPQVKFIDPFSVDSAVFDYSPNANPERFRYRSEPIGYQVISGIVSQLLKKFESPEFFAGRRFRRVDFRDFKHHMIEPVTRSIALYVDDGYVVSECSVSSKDPVMLQNRRWSNAGSISHFSAHNGRVWMRMPDDFDTTELEALLK